MRFILNWLRRQMVPDEVPPPTRLSASAAIELAKRAAAGDSQGPILSMATVQERSGRLIWSVSAPVMGRTLEVQIDDQTGQMVAIHHHGVR